VPTKIDRNAPPSLIKTSPVEATVKPPPSSTTPAAAGSTKWSDSRPQPGHQPPGARIPSTATPAALWGAPADSDAAKIAAIKTAMATQPQAELAKTLAEASKASPHAYRTALRDTLEGHLKDASKLQRHLTLLDLDGDGQVTMKENYKSLRQLGMSPPKAILIGGASQLALIFSTRESFGTSIPIKNGDKGQHESVHTGGMDPEVDLTKKLDEMMKEDQNGDGYLDMGEIGNLIDKRAELSSSNKIAKALVKAANKAEFAALFSLVGGKMNRDDLKDFYTGSLFFSLLPPDALAQRLTLLRDN
jgi:Ca2+-binding EF-hand superfamily protein